MWEHYCKHHSTETALLYIHDHLINAIGSQQLSCLSLLNLSAAFDTTDHSILLTRLSSWFGIHGSVLNWFKSYLSSHSFRLRCNNTFSSFYTSSRGVPKAPFSVLCFLSCTLPPSALSSPPFPLTITFMLTTPNCSSHLPGQLRLKHHPPAECHSSNLFLADCQSPNSQFLQNLTHWTKKATWQDTELHT